MELSWRGAGGGRVELVDEESKMLHVGDLLLCVSFRWIVFSALFFFFFTNILVRTGAIRSYILLFQLF